MGVTASVIDLTALDDGMIRLIVKGIERVSIVQFAEGQFLSAEVAAIEESRDQEAEAFALSRAVLEEFRQYRREDVSAPLYARFPHIREPGGLADAIAPHLPVEIERRQDLLETSDVIARLEKILALMKAERQGA